MTNILQILEDSPALLASQAVKVRLARKRLDDAKHALEVAMAESTIRHAGAKNQMILKAHVTADPSVRKAEGEVITTDAQYDIEQIEHRKLYDQFLSARKIAGLDERELHALSGSTIRQSVVRDEQGNRVDAQTGEILDSPAPQ